MSSLKTHPPPFMMCHKNTHSVVFLLPLVLDFDQMKCSLQAPTFRSFPPPPFFLQRCFQIVVPGRVDFCLSSAHFHLSIFYLSCPFQLNSTLLCFSSHLSSSAVIPPQPAAAAVSSFPSPRSPHLLSLFLSSLPIHSVGAEADLGLRMLFLHCPASLVSVASCFPFCD